tara:strand:+ start:1425 stop:1889 length:465 start_codon:yes stop_codon:yes gene_type:complete
VGEGDICSPLAGAHKEGERKTRRTEKENETMSENVDNRNEVEIDLEKYDTLINNLYKKEKEIAKLKAEAEAQKKSIAPKKKRRILDIFLDDNDVNEKAIVGFVSFGMMVAFGIFDLITAMDGTPLEISDTIYTSFVVVTLGCFGISEAGKAFGK